MKRPTASSKPTSVGQPDANTPAAEPAVALPAATVLTGAVVDTAATAEVPPTQPDTAIAETIASSPLPALEAAAETVTEAVLADMADEDGVRVKVICHTKGGRRRAGRRWPEGETILPLSALSNFARDQLQGDPRFTIGLMPREAI